MYDPSIVAEAGQAFVGEDPGEDLVEELAQDFVQYLAESEGSGAGGDPRPPEGGELAGGFPAQRADQGAASKDAPAGARAFRPATAASDASERANQARESRPGEQTTGKVDGATWSRETGDEGSGLVLYKTSLTLVRDEVRLKRMKHGVTTSARLIEEEMVELRRGGFRWKAVFLTLTYRPGETWSPKDIAECIQRVRVYLGRRGIRCVYVWVAEIQERRAEARPGETALHYHVMFWLPRGISLPMPDKRGWWTHGSTRIEWAQKPVGYLTKYASKGGLLDYVPSGARLSGFGGLSKGRRTERAWWMLPSYIREKWGQEHRPCRATGGGWLSRLTGEVMESAWRLVAVNHDWGVMWFERVMT